MVISLERGADLHIVQLMPLPLTVFCFSKIQIGFTFLVPAHPGSPGQRAVKRVLCLCVFYFTAHFLVLCNRLNWLASAFKFLLILVIVTYHRIDYLEAGYKCHY